MTKRALLVWLGASLASVLPLFILLNCLMLPLIFLNQSRHWFHETHQIESSLATALADHARAHDGWYPATWQDLRPGVLQPSGDPLVAKMAGDRRPAWLVVGYLALLTFLFARAGPGTAAEGQRRVWRRMTAGLAVLTVVAVVIVARYAVVPLRDYAYLQRVVLLPGCRAPMPPDVPLAWFYRPFINCSTMLVPADAANSSYWSRPVTYGLTNDDAVRLFQTESVPIDTCFVSPAEAAGKVDLVRTALRRNPAVAAELRKLADPSAEHPDIALWGLYLQDDPQTRTVAEAQLASERRKLHDYAKLILARLPAPQSAP